MTTLALLSTAPSVPAALDPLVTELLQGIDRFHLVDETLLRTARADGVTDAVAARIAAHVDHAAASGADVFLVTCSSIGEVADALAEVAPIPVRRIDRPMAVEAATIAEHIAVLATLSSTLGPTMRLVEGEARRRHGAAARVEATVCDGAFEALQSGDVDAHDAAVAAAIRQAAGWAGVVVLAQASMARAGGAGRRAVPVLSSPRSGIAQLRADLSLTT